MTSFGHPPTEPAWSRIKWQFIPNFEVVIFFFDERRESKVALPKNGKFSILQWEASFQLELWPAGLGAEVPTGNWHQIQKKVTSFRLFLSFSSSSGNLNNETSFEYLEKKFSEPCLRTNDSMEVFPNMKDLSPHVFLCVFPQIRRVAQPRY